MWISSVPSVSSNGSIASGLKALGGRFEGSSYPSHCEAQDVTREGVCHKRRGGSLFSVGRRHCEVSPRERQEDFVLLIELPDHHPKKNERNGSQSPTADNIHTRAMPIDSRGWSKVHRASLMLGRVRCARWQHREAQATTKQGRINDSDKLHVSAHLQRIHDVSGVIE